MFRYIGNKTKLLTELHKSVSDAIGDTGTVADVMAGTGSVATSLRINGYRVIASDLMTYSKYHLMTNLLTSDAPDFQNLCSFIGTKSVYDYCSLLKHMNHLEPVNGYFFREFSPSGNPENGSPPRKYFTSENAKIIDAIREIVEEWKSLGLVSPIEEAILKHTLIMAANRVANISGTYGYFMSKFGKSSLDLISLNPVSFIAKGRTDNVVLQGAAEELASDISADLCYIDPPYMKRQYAANYHILETLARGDNPVAEGKSGLRPWRDQYSNLCTKTKGLDAFLVIMKKMDCPVFLISYSEDGLFPVEQLVDEFRKVGAVSVRFIEHKRFRSNKSSLPHEIRECIITVNKS